MKMTVSGIIYNGVKYEQKVNDSLANIFIFQSRIHCWSLLENRSPVIAET